MIWTIASIPYIAGGVKLEMGNARPMPDGLPGDGLRPGEAEVFLSPTQASSIARRGRQLLQAGQLTHHQLALLDCLLWRCRKHGQAAACASYSGLQRLCHMARDTVWTGLQRLESLGLIRKVRQRVKVGWATRTATSIYVFGRAASESGERTPLREIPKKEAQEISGARDAIASLARVRKEREAMLFRKPARQLPRALVDNALSTITRRCAGGS